MSQHSHHTRNKGASQPLRSLFAQDTSASAFDSTSELISDDKAMVSETIKADIDVLLEPSSLLSSTKDSDLAQEIRNQKQILEDYQHIKIWLQQQEANMNRLLTLYDQLNNHNNPISSIKSAVSTSTADPTTKQLRSKQINQLFESPPFSGSRSQDVVDWLEEFNRKCDEITLEDVHRLSVARGLMTNDTKLWADTLKNHSIDWQAFQQKLISYFQLTAGIDCFSFSEQLYTRQQQLHESAIQYYHDVIRLCSKVDLNMDNDTRLKHLYRGLRRETKLTIDIKKFQAPDDFLQELGRLEQLQKDFETNGDELLTMMPSTSNIASMSNEPPSYANNESFRQYPQQQLHHQQRQPYQQHQQFHQQTPHSSNTPSRPRYRTYPFKSSSQYQNQQQPTSNNTSRHLNGW